MKINQKEIAKRVGVSQTTVSFVLNNKKEVKISPETRKKIIEVAEEIGYRKFYIPVEEGFKTGNIGYIFPFKSSLQDPYYHRFYSGVLEGVEDKNLNLILYKLKNCEEILYRIDILKKVDGLIIEEKINDEIVEKIKDKIPIVLLNHKTEKISCDCVMPDNKGGIIKAIEYLFRKGHRNIGIFGMKPLFVHTKERLDGYIEGMKLFGLKIKDEYISLPERKIGGIKELNEYAIKTLKDWFKLKERPTATVTFGDVYALSLIGMAQKVKIRIPDDLSIIGFDNIINCLYSHPTLTSIEQPLEQMGKKAVNLLIERIKNPDKRIEKVIFEVELIERESVKDMNERR
ncbi:MAG: LacI family transcriptional regulator [Candidatus Omnitrophica bacterium]|nr:LacI family transcriptional regulator [Candidatus Omnitrophota bacterium]MCM8803313.1 LacI family transcriptional regulator [Candidatus Omnitrophota bacterium]